MMNKALIDTLAKSVARNNFNVSTAIPPRQLSNIAREELLDWFMPFEISDEMVSYMVMRINEYYKEMIGETKKELKEVDHDTHDND